MDYPKESTLSRLIDESFSLVVGSECRFEGIEFKYFGKNRFGTKMWLHHYRREQKHTYWTRGERFLKSDDVATTLFDFAMNGYGIWNIRFQDVTWWRDKKQAVVEIYLHKTKRMNTNITANVIDKLVSNL